MRLISEPEVVFREYHDGSSGMEIGYSSPLRVSSTA
jgi:hypothetical protein